jgi:hypothetical protein
MDRPETKMEMEAKILCGNPGPRKSMHSIKCRIYEKILCPPLMMDD